MKSIKEVFENRNIIITNILQGKNNQVRIDARTRFHIPDARNHFSKWCSLEYANRLSQERFGKKVTELRAFRY